MAKLNAAARKKLPESDFAVPSKRSKSGGQGGYPINDRSHAKNALARSAGKPEHAAVVMKVKRKYPDMKIDSGIARD